MNAQHRTFNVQFPIKKLKEITVQSKANGFVERTYFLTCNVKPVPCNCYLSTDKRIYYEKKPAVLV